MRLYGRLNHRTTAYHRHPQSNVVFGVISQNVPATAVSRTTTTTTTATVRIQDAFDLRRIVVVSVVFTVDRVRFVGSIVILVYNCWTRRFGGKICARPVTETPDRVICNKTLINSERIDCCNKSHRRFQLKSENKRDSTAFGSDDFSNRFDRPRVI